MSIFVDYNIIPLIYEEIKLQCSSIVRQKIKKHLQIYCKCLIMRVAQLGLEPRTC